ncbi:MAG: hypothetical protein AAFN70_12710, partial [Planctomycetota bacterium]
MSVYSLSNHHPSVRRLGVSIVVPVGDCESEFEQRLADVLQHTPSRIGDRDVQFIVPHDGSYHDPFEIGETVSFVRCASVDLVPSIRDAVNLIDTDLTAIVGAGVNVDQDWIEVLVDRLLRDQIDCVGPVCITEENQTLHGWCLRGVGFHPRFGDAVQSPAAPLLATSLWRSEALRGCSDMLGSDDTACNQFAWFQWAARVGNGCGIEPASVAHIDARCLAMAAGKDDADGHSEFARAAHLDAICEALGMPNSTDPTDWLLPWKIPAAIGRLVAGWTHRDFPSTIRIPEASQPIQIQRDDQRR